MRKVSRWFQRNLIRIYAVVAFTYLFIPVAYTFAFSFNDSRKSNLVWQGFTLENWQNPCGAPEICTALGNSIKIGFLATLFSTILGTMIAWLTFVFWRVDRLAGIFFTPYLLWVTFAAILNATLWYLNGGKLPMQMQP